MSTTARRSRTPTGTPKELDEQLPGTLTQFVGAHIELKNTLEIAKEEMTAATRSARAKKSSKASNAATTTSKTANTVSANAAGKPAEEKKPTCAMTANFFNFDETPAPAEAPKQPESQAPPDSKETDEESEILAEIDESDQEGAAVENATRIPIASPNSVCRIAL
ncbi:MAG TPA: hypothetical protein VFE22_05205 [Edaphobacter sp.]|nr:hypothetical protein [Edaphobacter sp.]